MSLLGPRPVRAKHYCGFCGKAEHEVLVLIVGVGDVAICDECIEDASQHVVDKKVAMGAVAVVRRVTK